MVSAEAILARMTSSPVFRDLSQSMRTALWIVASLGASVYLAYALYRDVSVKLLALATLVVAVLLYAVVMATCGGKLRQMIGRCADERGGRRIARIVGR